ncbi:MULTISPECIES: ArsR/SmtB family transcription factor [Sporosarcina]|uniref:ArsR/SmtB family transcription factor n=1 Tax=Sporosarcina TaxID=1569 RepID=UPI000590CFC8|nr:MULTISPECIES: metalloregulator ArsR/SmtB family transcription factor [Sporosarcina]WJY28093.1 metalloregulator ArsR/SmtB family transcription factor [Sporosarcina sp. 0.2-SM1T-5]
MELIQLEKELKALADAKRLLLLACMKDREVCVCDLTDALQISQPAVSQHLRKLKDAGFIQERRVGTWRHYSIREDISPLFRQLIDGLERPDSCDCGGTSCCM